MTPIDPQTVLVIDYTNHAGKRSYRQIVPLRLWFGKSEYHPAQVDEAWYLKAVDATDKAERDFLMTSIHETMSLSIFEARAVGDERWREQQLAWQNAKR